MPKIYEYLGIIIRFFSNEHEPIHIHAIYQDAQIKVSFYLKDGNITKIEYEKEKGDFPETKLKDLKKFINQFKYRLINMWIEYFIYKKKIRFTKITKTL